MNIVIASSKPWFQLHDDVAANHQVHYIRDAQDLTADHLNAIKPDVIFFPHWNWKVASDIHENFTCIVFHTAPLPYGRGGSPIQNLILNGHTEAPVCALRMTDELDAGPIYATHPVSLDGPLSAIFDRINDAVNHLIATLTTGVLPNPVPQSGESHYFNRRGETDNKIPKDIDLKQLYDFVRMLDDPSYPAAYILHGDYKIELSDAALNDDSVTATCKIIKC